MARLTDNAPSAHLKLPRMQRPRGWLRTATMNSNQEEVIQANTSLLPYLHTACTLFKVIQNTWTDTFFWYSTGCLCPVIIWLQLGCVSLIVCHHLDSSIVLVNTFSTWYLGYFWLAADGWCLALSTGWGLNVLHTLNSFYQWFAIQIGTLPVKCLDTLNRLYRIYIIWMLVDFSIQIGIIDVQY